MHLNIPLQRIGDHSLPPPEMATAQAAGCDLCACLAQDILLAPGQRTLVPTGFAMALPAGFEAQIRPRSGLALKHGLTVLNSPGTIDADYRGEIKVLLVNLGQETIALTNGMRIAQMVIAAHATPSFTLTLSLDETPRNAGGFGSTGV